MASVAGRKLSVARPLTSLSSDGKLIELSGFESNPQESAKVWPARTKWIWIVLAGIFAVCLWRAYTLLIRSRCSAMIAAFMARYSARQTLRQACHSNDPDATRRALIVWARLVWPSANINSLSQLSAWVESSHLEDALAQLDAALYANRSSEWQGSNLWQLLAARQHRGTVHQPGSKGNLPGLYPQS